MTMRQAKAGKILRSFLRVDIIHRNSIKTNFKHRGFILIIGQGCEEEVLNQSSLQMELKVIKEKGNSRTSKFRRLSASHSLKLFFFLELVKI